MPSAFSSDRYAVLAEVLARARQDAGMSQVELAARLKRPQSYVSNVERRERRVDVVDFYDWAIAVSANPKALFGVVCNRLADGDSNKS